MNYVLLFGMPGGGELFLIVLVIIMFFGSKKIPELARGLGKGMREIKNATNDIQKEIREGARELSSVKSTIDDIKGSVDVKKQINNMLDKELSKNPPPQKEHIPPIKETEENTEITKENITEGLPKTINRDTTIPPTSPEIPSEDKKPAENS